jgi:hypothetical protein
VSDSGYVLIIESTGYPDGLDVEGEKKRETKEHSKTWARAIEK